MKASIGIAVLLLLGFFAFTIYAFYDGFLAEESNPFSLIFAVFVVLILICVIISAILAKLSDSYPKSKILKFVKTNFERVTESIMEAFSSV